MVTWGDYAIIAVQYDDDGSEIVKVKRGEVGEEMLLNKVERPRSKVITDINLQQSDYTTALKNDNGDWAIGEEVHVVVADGDKYIRTDQNDVAEDNLGELPEF